MEENLLGYLLNALDAQTHADVESYLRVHPESQQRLDALRRVLAPLEADREEIEPPAGLWVRTLGRIAEHTCRELPQAPVIPLTRAPSPPRRWWRRADVLVAASLFVCFLGLLPPALTHVRRQQQLVACQNNLQQIGGALLRYRDLDHSAAEVQHRAGAFPNVAHHQEPRNVAGLFIPTIVASGALDPDQVNVNCPSSGPALRPRWSLAELMNMPLEEFERHAAELSPSYAYSLGYRNQGGQIAGFCRDDGIMPIASDSPPPERAGLYEGRGNSLNHDGRGQNLLFTDGSVRFHTQRSYGSDDDIFLNQARKPAAGLHRGDIVLGASAARPKPAEPPGD